MILTRSKIKEAIEQKRIIIEPYSEELIGPASYDLHLGNSFRRFKAFNDIFHVRDNAKAEEITELVHLEDTHYLLIKPGETVLGITREKLTFAPDISGWLEGRSRFARIGLTVHITSGFIQPGISNYQVLEITNSSPNSLALYPGIRFCQIIFEECAGEATYLGQYKEQTEP